MTDQATEIIITSFHPLSVTLPEGDTLEGKVRIVLPDVHVQLIDLSMGGIIPGAHLGSDAAIVGYNIEFLEPVETVEIMKFVVKSADLFEQIWEAYQAEFDKKGALL
jgi:hypothetical protein